MVVSDRTGSQPDVFEDCILCINAVIFPPNMPPRHRYIV